MKVKKISPKKKIINAAIRCFGKTGIENTKLIEIAQFMGIQHSAILYHFKNFDHLCNAVIEDLIEEFYTAGEKLLPPTSAQPLEYIQTFVRVHFLMAKKNKTRFSLWLHFYYKASQDERYHQKLKMIRLNSSEKLKTLLAQFYSDHSMSEAQKKQKIEDNATFILGLLSGNLILSLTDREQNFEHYLEHTQRAIESTLAN